MPDINDYGPIADLYDTYVPATFDIPFFLNEAKQTSGEILELMAGTGRVSIPLVEQGARLTCEDRSAEMIAILRDKLAQRGLTAETYAVDVCDLDLGKQFDQIIIPFHSFHHIVAPDDQRRALARIRQHLAPNGQFICTLGNPLLSRESNDGKLRLFSQHTLPDGKGTLLFWILERRDPSDDHIRELFEFFEEYDVQGVLTSKRLMKLWTYMWSQQEFRDLIQAAGFRVIALYGDYQYGDFHADTSPYMIWRLGI